jgi:hypothetical protein
MNSFCQRKQKVPTLRVHRDIQGTELQIMRYHCLYIRHTTAFAYAREYEITVTCHMECKVTLIKPGCR